MASRRLNDLDPSFRPLAVELLARAVESKIDPRIIETRRTQAEHEENVRRGRSWTSHSLHCDGLAIDVCPLSYLGRADWEPNGQLWLQLGAIAQNLGMEWGGDWKQTPDRCHFQVKR